MISRRALARALGMETASLARADRRGHGPGRPVLVGPTHVCYRETDVVEWLKERGLELVAGTVRPIETPPLRLVAGGSS